MIIIVLLMLNQIDFTFPNSDSQHDNTEFSCNKFLDLCQRTKHQWYANVQESNELYDSYVRQFLQDKYLSQTISTIENLVHRSTVHDVVLVQFHLMPKILFLFVLVFLKLCDSSITIKS